MRGCSSPAPQGADDGTRGSARVPLTAILPLSKVRAGAHDAIMASDRAGRRIEGPELGSATRSSVLAAGIGNRRAGNDAAKDARTDGCSARPPSIIAMMMVVMVHRGTPSPMRPTAVMRWAAMWRASAPRGPALHQFDLAIGLEFRAAKRRCGSWHRPSCEHCGKNNANDGFSNRHRYLKSSCTACITFFRLSRSTDEPAFKERESNQANVERPHENGARRRRAPQTVVGAVYFRGTYPPLPKW